MLQHVGEHGLVGSVPSDTRLNEALLLYGVCVLSFVYLLSIFSVFSDLVSVRSILSSECVE
jgi:hypothetical protein